MTDELEATVRAAPEQWYSFKPMWPATEAEAAELEARATAVREGGAVRRRGPAAAGAGVAQRAAVDSPSRLEAEPS
jgi:hypothetical protein